MMYERLEDSLLGYSQKFYLAYKKFKLETNKVDN